MMSPKKAHGVYNNIIMTIPVEKVRPAIKNGVKKFNSKIDMQPYEKYWQPFRSIVYTCLATAVSL